MSASRGWRIIHVLEDMAAVAGGVPAVVQQLSTRLATVGVRSQIVHAVGTPDTLPARVEAYGFQPDGIRRVWAWGKGLRRGIAQLIDQPDPDMPLFHLHGVWSAPQYFAAKAAHKSGVPFLLTAHGMLEPWLWSRQGWRVRVKKEAYWKMLAYPAMQSASVIHAITPMERDHLRRLFPRNQIEVIPNAVDCESTRVVSSDTSGLEKTILFLGRIEPKKGVDLLIEAFVRAKIGPEWKVVIIGPTWSEEFQLRLGELVKESHMEHRVSFLGPVFGQEKIAWLKKAWVMVAPSHSEVVGLVNLEAGVHKLPTITTHQTGLFDWERGGGVLIQPDSFELKRALEQACSWSDSERSDRGRASHDLIESRYSWKAVLPMWVSLYDSMIKRG